MEKEAVALHLPLQTSGFFTGDLSHEVEITSMESALLGMLEKLQESKDANSILFGRKICVSNDIFGGMVKGRSLGVGRGNIEFG